MIVEPRAAKRSGLGCGGAILGGLALVAICAVGAFINWPSLPPPPARPAPPAPPSPQPAAAPREPEPPEAGESPEPAESGKVEIISIDNRVTVKNDIYWQFAWNAEIANDTNRDARLWVECLFLDADGFIVARSGRNALDIPAGETRTHRDTKLVAAENAPNIKSTRVTAEPAFRKFRGTPPSYRRQM